MNIDRFINDHNAIMTSVKELRLLVQAGVSPNAEKIATSMIQMSAKIKLHLSTEDSMLYPAMIGSPDSQIAQIGQAFQTEMGGIAAVYGAFASKWNLGKAIAADPEGFRREANEIFKALHHRIQRENVELYPLAAKA
jgi:Hemerythrin HHE cation binding domain